MSDITVAVLTVSDRCAEKTAVDESGPAVVEMIKGGIVKGAKVVQTSLLPDDKELVANQIKAWCDEEKIGIVLTTGGTGLSLRDVTPEATAPLLQKEVPGIPMLMFKRSSEVTPLAALSRALAGVRGRSLVVNLPGSKKAATECLEAIASVLPHAADLVSGRDKEVQASHLGFVNGRKSSVQVTKEKPTESPFPCVSVSDAQKTICDRIYHLRKKCTVRLEDARGFILAEDVVSMDFLPPHDASLKDGYAVRAPCSSSSTLSVIGSVHCGSPSASDLVVTSDNCVKISTGAPLPPGANAVVPVEYTRKDTSGKIILQKDIFVGDDVRPKGEDFKSGQLLLETKTLLDSAALGLLAAAGITSPRVFAKPTVAIFSTGNEVVEPSVGDLGPGKIRDSNRITLKSLLNGNNFSVADLGIVLDSPDALCDALDRAFRKADVVVTTGSMSMGDRDYLKEILKEDFGAEICFGRIFMKPGKPTAFAIVPYEGKFKIWFGLPGNPASAVVTAHLFVLPALRKISGYENPFPEVLDAVLEDPKIQADDRPHYLRGKLNYNISDKHYEVKTTGIQNSSRIASCTGADCLILLEEGTAKTKGVWVPVLRLGTF